MRQRNGRAFALFLAGQGILNLGEAVRFIALTVLIYKLAGSGITAAAGVAIAALPGIIASPFSGVLGDRVNESRILILTDIARFITVPLFLYAHDISLIYLLLVVISLYDILYGPSRKKFVLGLTGKDEALTANSRLMGVSGAAYLAGPMLAGVLTDKYGPAPAIIIAAVSCIISSGLTISAVIANGGYGAVKETGTALGNSMGWPGRGPRPGGRPRSGNGPRPGGGQDSFLGQFAGGIGYCQRAAFIRELLAIGLVTGFCTISVNLSFYPFAFDALSVTAKGWSLMITVYYGTNLAAMLLVGLFEKRKGRHAGRLFYLCLFMVSVIWFQYSYIRSYPAVLLLQFVEGTAIAVCGILLAARYQKLTDRAYMARVSGISDISGSAGKLAGMGCTTLIMRYAGFSSVFAATGILMMLFILVSLTKSEWLRSNQ